MLWRGKTGKTPRPGPEPAPCKPPPPPRRRWRFRLVSALVALPGCGCDDSLMGLPAKLEAASGTSRAAIVSGTPSASHDFPATGVILYHSDDPNSPMGSMLCSGTLVAPDVVLAAGHCQELFEEKNGPRVAYYFSLARDVSHFGPLVDRVPDDAVPVRYFLPHPDYDAHAYNRGLGRAADLGLFFLARAVTSVQPATLIAETDLARLVAGARVTIVGYGRRLTTALSGRSEGIKHQGQSTIRSIGPFEMQVGAGFDDALKCNGDSGGPTYLTIDGPRGPRAALVGITSRAQDWASCRMGGIDTRVDAYLPWIAQSLAWACSQQLRWEGCASAPADLTTLSP